MSRAGLSVWSWRHIAAIVNGIAVEKIITPMRIGFILFKIDWEGVEVYFHGGLNRYRFIVISQIQQFFLIIICNNRVICM